MKNIHLEDVKRIYQAGIDTGIATFESSAPSPEEWDDKFHNNCRLVGIIDDKVIGWAALQPVSEREVYAGVAEETVYVDPHYHGQGIGTLLLGRLIEESENEGYWMLTAAIFRENAISIHVHKKLGFRIVGIREKVARKDGKWTDTVLMDRRSKVVGMD